MMSSLHGTKASTVAMNIFFQWLWLFSEPSQVVLKRSRFRLIFKLLSCSGVGTAVSCSLVPALASNHLTASMALPPLLALVDFDRATPWSTTPPRPTLTPDSRVFSCKVTINQPLIDLV